MTDDYDWSGGAPDPLAPYERKLLPQLGHERILYSTDGMSPGEWLTARRKHRTVGASHVAGIMQRHPWMTPISVASTLRGLAYEDFGPEESFRMELGTVCEKQIRRVMAASLDVPVLTPNNVMPRYMTTWPQVLQHPTIDCFTCNLDAAVFLDGDRLPGECKWTSWRNRLAWRTLSDTLDITEAIGTSVLAYYIQTQSQLSITGLDRALLIGIVGEDAACRMLMNIVQGREGIDAFNPRDWDVVICTIPRDKAMIADIERVVPRFYERFVKGEEWPPVTNPSVDLPALRDSFRLANPPKPIAHMPELDELARKYRGIVKEIGKGEKLRDARKADLLHALVEAKIDEATTGHYRLTYKERADGARVFRVSDTKQGDET